MSLRNRLVALAALITAAGMSIPAEAQYVTDFEGLTASDVGVEVVGQDGYYIPDAGGVSGLAHTYAGNPFGIRANPCGGAQFVSSSGPGGSVFSRSQRDVTFGDGTGTWRVTYDIKVVFVGTLPSAQNVGSFSVQRTPGGSNFTVILLATWTDPALAETWNADIIWFDALGTQLQEMVPDPGFQTLATGTWFRQSMVFDIESNSVVELSVVNLDTGVGASYAPLPGTRYLAGGPTGGFVPTGFRLFGGAATVAGNTIAWDNLAIRQAGDTNGDGAVNVTDLLEVIGEWGTCHFGADLNADGDVGVNDLLEVTGNWT